MRLGNSADVQTHTLGHHVLKALSLAHLLFKYLHFTRKSSLLLKTIRCTFSRAIECLLCAFIFPSQLERPTDLVNETAEIFWRLRRNVFNIALKNKKVLRFG